MNLEASVVLDRLRERKDAVPVVLMTTSAILVVLVLWKVGGFFSTSSWAMRLASKAALVGRSGEGDTAKHLEKSKNTADALKKKNLFAPPEAKQHPVKAVPGILGSSAFINGKWLGEGQNIGDAKVVSVEPTQVKIEWEGDEKTFLPIMGGAGGESGPGGRPGSSRSSSSGRPGDRGPEVAVVGQPGPGGFRPGMMGGPGGMQGMRERFMNMSEQERQAFRDRMRAQFGGGGPGGFRGPGGGDFGRGRGDFGGRGGPGGGRGSR